MVGLKVVLYQPEPEVCELQRIAFKCFTNLLESDNMRAKY